MLLNVVHLGFPMAKVDLKYAHLIIPVSAGFLLSLGPSNDVKGVYIFTHSLSDGLCTASYVFHKDNKASSSIFFCKVGINII